VQLRDEFLGIASHELKNPLTALQGSAQLLQRRLGRRADLDERERRMLTLLGAQAKRMRLLIDTMLDVSRIDAGRLTIERAPLDLTTLVRRVVEEVAVPHEPGRLACESPDGRITVAGDDLRLEQVFQNLLQNALRYSPDDTLVRVRVARQGGQASVAITDRGSGIPAVALPHLFERYYRAPNSEGRRSGMGVGLFVVREIVALHGGEVTVESAEGAGSTFTVWLDLAAQQEGRPDLPASASADMPSAMAV
jgi:signal transduction histidine kinase